MTARTPVPPTVLEGLRASLRADIYRIWDANLDEEWPLESIDVIGVLVTARIQSTQRVAVDLALRVMARELGRAFGMDALPVLAPMGKYVGIDHRGRIVRGMVRGARAYYVNLLAAGHDQETALRRARSLHTMLGATVAHDTARAVIVDQLDPGSGVPTHPQLGSWSRIPEPGACDFCNMLGGRGFVYTSRETAAVAADGGRYHDRCRCSVAVGASGVRSPTAERLYQQWADGGARTQWGEAAQMHQQPMPAQLPPVSSPRMLELADQLEKSAVRLEAAGNAKAAERARADAARLRAQAVG